MQDKYVGDIGDYGKLTLLRHLARTTNLKVGIVWCATDGRDEENNDGSIRSYRSYTGKHCLRHCDKELFDAFANFDDKRHRRIDKLEPLTLARYFFRDELTRTNREVWLARAFESMENADLVFFDPDDGISASHSKPNPKQIKIGQLRDYWNRGQSVLVYHQLGRQSGGHDAYIISLINKLKDGLECAEIAPLRFRRGTSRVFFLIMQPQHREALIDSIKAEPWKALSKKKSEWAKVSY